MTADHDLALQILRAGLARPEAQFRDGQWQAIQALVQHRAKLLVVRQTGWGKSLVYCMAARVLRERGAIPRC